MRFSGFRPCGQINSRCYQSRGLALEHILLFLEEKRLIKGAKQQGDKTGYRLYIWKSTRQEEQIKDFLLLYTQICSKENTLVGGYPDYVSAPSGSLSCQSRGHVVNGNAAPGGNGGGGGAGTNNTGVDDNGEDSDELNDVMEVLTRYGHQKSPLICGSLMLTKR